MGFRLEVNRLTGHVRPLQPLIGAYRVQKTFFANFGTLQGDAIDSSDSDFHLGGDPLPADALANNRLFLR